MSDFIVGLTGGIGSGKSTVADLFVAEGGVLVDTDAIAHALTGPGGQAMPALISAFGAEIARPDGGLDRAAMRRKVFGDDSARTRLEGILHPMIREIAAQCCREASSPYVILAVPLLVESGNYRERCDRVAVVDCPETLQVERVMRRSGLSAQEVVAIIATQATREQRLAVADDVILNLAGIESLRDQVARLDRDYRRRSAEKAGISC